MQSASMFTLCSGLLAAAVLLGGCSINRLPGSLPSSLVTSSSVAQTDALKLGAQVPRQLPGRKVPTGDVAREFSNRDFKAASGADFRSKTEGLQGEVLGEPVDCDGDGIVDESRIDFDGDGASDECIEGVEAIPEPPFQQTYTPTSETFNSLLPAVGWDAQYQCGDGLYEVTLSRPAADKLSYSSQGLTLTTPIVYDDLDPNLNQPLIVQDPEAGIRYAFTQLDGNEFYEYAIADYSGNIGLYVYQTGEQIVATPCVVASQS